MFNFDAKALFKQRLIDHIKLLNRYLRYIFNGHFMIALLFIIITLAVYYQQWLETINEQFPASIVMAIILGVVVSYNPIQSFLKDPDRVFLIVKEQAMHQYFQYALLYNYIVQLYMVVVALAVIGPLYTAVHPTRDSLDFVVLVLLVLLFKGWNLVTNWTMFKIRNRNVLFLDKLLRLLLSVSLFYFLLEKTLVIFIVILYFVYVVSSYLFSRNQSGLAWDVLIENDEHRLSVFYRFVSMFAEVPQQTKRLKKRRLLTTWVEKRIPFSQKATFSYLYRLTFIRSNDYLNLFVRLTIIGAIVIYVIPNGWMKVAFALLFIYMTSFQMIPLYHHYRTSIWIDLYPMRKQNQRNAYVKAMKQLAFLQTIIFGLLFLTDFDVVRMILTIGMGTLFVYLFFNYYVKQKIEAE